jgi:bacillopeptidase F (M6 metalloprotease family)
VLTSAAPLAVPAGPHPYLRFEQYVGLPEGSGVLAEASRDGRAWASVPFLDNGYNGTAPDGKTKVFTGESRRWFSSRADLSAFAGKKVYVRFRILPSDTPDNLGWWLDDVTVYGCGDGKPTAPGGLAFDGTTDEVAVLLWDAPAARSAR